MPKPVAAPIITHTEVSLRAQVNYVLSRAIAKQFYLIWPLTDLGIRALRLLDLALGLVPRLREVEYAPAELGPVPAERYLPTTRTADRLEGASVLYLHGGGFTFCGLGTHRRVTARMAQTLCTPVYSVQYRHLPDGGAGTAVHDACAAYRHLLQICPDPDRIIVAGDSSGAFLAAKICELAAADGLTPPAAYIGYSAHVDLDADHRGREIIGRDALMPVSAYRRVKKRWAAGPMPLRGARSLLAMDPQVFPPAFLTAASKEMFEADILDLTTRLAESGRTVETHIWRRQVHAFPVLDAILPESREAMRSTAEFLRRTMPGRDRTAA